MIRLCQHCLELATTLHACGETLEATSQHYAMALVRKMRAERRELSEIVKLLELFDRAPELEPAVTQLHRPPPIPLLEPFPLACGDTHV